MQRKHLNQNTKDREIAKTTNRYDGKLAKNKLQNYKNVSTNLLKKGERNTTKTAKKSTKTLEKVTKDLGETVCKNVRKNFKKGPKSEEEFVFNYYYYNNIK